MKIIDDVIIIGIDSGYGNIKTANCCFPASLSAYDREPVFKENLLVFEGKYNGMRPCRAIYGEDREMMDIIFGPFFICDCSTSSFGSLNKEQQERYKKQFQNPERFFRIGGEIKAVPYKPEIDRER